MPTPDLGAAAVHLMASRDPRIALVVATSDRTREIRRMLASLSAQSSPPERIVVVDAGAASAKGVVAEFPSLDIVYMESPVRSAARQRNSGIGAAGGSADLIGFADDDVEFEPDAFRAMKDFWRRAPADLVGAGFNMVNHPQLAAANMKSSPLAESLGLYGAKKGRVLRSGFQTMIGAMDKTTEVQWLPTTAAVWRRPIFELYQFDEWFSAYSYLEDLDFSYRAGKSGRLAVVSDARYFHMMAPAGREGSYAFGQREILNRLYFVRKHPELSTSRCVLALILRMAMSFFLYVKKGDGRFLQRLLGNIAGFRRALFQGMTIFSH